ncbi:MAG: hypothetical protein ACRETT_07305 [Steroidobacteraceae bacterium]
MPEVIVALYDSYGAAAHARTDLVAEGFPTDRVELTARIDEGRAGAVPGGLKRGGATITVHRPLDIEGRDLGSHAGVCVARTGEPARGA